MPRSQTSASDASSAGAKGAAPVAVLAKAVAVLDHVAEEGEVTPARLAELTGEPRSTVYRLLASLQELGLIEAGRRRGTYVLGIKLFRLGSTIVSRFDERQAALPVMERLNEELGDNIFLCVRRGYEAVCIERIDGARVTLLALALGGSLPLHAGAVTRAILAFEPREFWEEYVEHHGVEVFTPKTPASREALFAELEATRERGYAISDEDVTPGVAAIGAPIFDHTGRVRAGLSLGGVREALFGHESRALEMLLEGTAEVSRALGHDPSAAARA
jgi:DNA-binding IclR family transcriptional regulator